MRPVTHHDVRTVGDRLSGQVTQERRRLRGPVVRLVGMHRRDHVVRGLSGLPDVEQHARQVLLVHPVDRIDLLSGALRQCGVLLVEEGDDVEQLVDQ